VEWVIIALILYLIERKSPAALQSQPKTQTDVPADVLRESWIKSGSTGIGSNEVDSFSGVVRHQFNTDDEQIAMTTIQDQLREAEKQWVEYRIKMSNQPPSAKEMDGMRKVQADLAQKQKDLQNDQAAINISLSALATGASIAAAAASVPVVGWIVGAAVAVATAISALILRFLPPPPPRTPDTTPIDHLSYRVGIDTYRGFDWHAWILFHGYLTPAGIGPDGDYDKFVSLVDRRLASYKALTGIDWFKWFPNDRDDDSYGIHFKNVGGKLDPIDRSSPPWFPFFFDALPEVSEVDAGTVMEPPVAAPMGPVAENPFPLIVRRMV
jgi:hypothetical protein